MPPSVLKPGSAATLAMSALLAALALHSLLIAPTPFAPHCWPVVSTCIWMVFVLNKGWENLDAIITGQVRRAALSAWPPRRFCVRF